ncbi:ACT domain-containing protein [Microbulbifer aggregans]|uniref:ACT domain-containing protein n=1 Tax=Microbulbifer aggregans TaxID=1769779 RepID=UPI001CFD91C5|nr:ACT domain-containing protein [Microbulbifer aggregans]
MNAQVQIERHLQRLRPILNRETLAVCKLDDAALREVLPDCLCVFRESEGTCALLPARVARDRELSIDEDYRQITLHFTPHLPIPGLAAAVLRELADAGLQGNMISARCHEYILVRERDANLAMQVLHGISNRLHYS